MLRLSRYVALFLISVVAFAEDSPSPSLPSTLPGDPSAFFGVATKVNGLGVSSLPPWHVKASFQILGTGGKVTESGTYEELHASGLKYKVTYASPSINRTVWVNEKGSFATSKSNWPADAEWMVRRSLFDVTPDPRLNSEFRSLMWRDGAPNTNTRCIDSLPMGVPPEADRKWWASYCYSTGTPIIRMGAEDLQYYQAIFNQIVFFHGTYVARDVELLHVGKPYFHLHIDMLEPLIDAREETFSAPPQALAVPRRLVMDTDLRYVAEQNEAGIRRPTDHRTRMPQMLGQEVIVQVLVNKLGHVTDARGVNGDSIARFEGLAAAGKWSFAPYLVEGEPTEYYTELEFY